MSATLSDGQAELRADDTDALVIGDGTIFAWHEDGPDWWSSTEIRTTDQPRSNANGSTPGRDLLGKHATILIVNVLADSEEAAGDAIDQWKAATAYAPYTLATVRLRALGRTRRRVGRFRKSDANAALARKGFVVACSTLFEALDGRTYGDTLNTATTTRVSPGSGFVAPFTPPFTLGASTPGTATITNAGKASAPWTARLDGPLDGIVIEHLQSGRRLDLSLTANGGVTLGAGDFLELDSDARSVLFNGAADRRNVLTIDSSWWELDPGDNSFVLNANTGSGTLTVNARDVFYS